MAWWAHVRRNVRVGLRRRYMAAFTPNAPSMAVATAITIFRISEMLFLSFVPIVFVLCELVFRLVLMFLQMPVCQAFSQYQSVGFRCPPGVDARQAG